MTTRKSFKRLVRARMAKTGERYATARRHVIANGSREPTARPTVASSRLHLTGNVPATTALRVLLTAAHVRAPHTHAPFTEAMLFGVAGGIGIGVFSFLYEKQDFASFYIAGRHDWANEIRYLTRAAERVGTEASIAEASGAKSR